MEANQGHEFYLVITPGFEQLALQELERWRVPLLAPPQVERGGLTLNLESLARGYALNQYLKIPTRILLRVGRFGCRDFPKLFKKASQVPWENWFSDDTILTFQASSHASRLFVKKRIETTCEEARERHLKNRGAPKNPTGREQKILVRLDDDVCTLSLDTSGDLLHKRGLRPLSSDAPIRETMASAVLQFLEGLKGNSSNVELVDPMMGGGTFFLEAALLDQVISSREYAFESFAGVEKTTPTATRDSSVHFLAFRGLEVSEKTIAAARENLSDVAIELQTTCADIFEADPQLSNAPKWLVTNPPYGERLKISVPLSRYYADLFESCERVFAPALACFILPEKARPLSLAVPKQWKRTADLAFSNGGLAVRAVVYERKH
ncbi:MAG TPA: hypothetical protein VM432_03730 [Bdellovibrionales bacterium]|nr:hypothetical protein [Bdellovibrionales bacterium]